MKNYQKMVVYLGAFVFSILSMQGEVQKQSTQKIEVKLARTRINAGGVAGKQNIFTGRITDDGGIRGTVRGFFVLNEGTRGAKDIEIKALKLHDWSKGNFIKENNLFIYCVNEKQLAKNSAFVMANENLDNEILNPKGEPKTYSVKFGIMIMSIDNHPIIVPAADGQYYQIAIPLPAS